MAETAEARKKRRIRQATNGPCTFHRAYKPNCGRPLEDETVHSWPDEPMRHGTHLWRREYQDIDRKVPEVTPAIPRARLLAYFPGYKFGSLAVAIETALDDIEAAVVAEERARLRAVVEALDAVECLPIADFPENSIDYGEGVCDERHRVVAAVLALLDEQP